MRALKLTLLSLALAAVAFAEGAAATVVTKEATGEAAIVKGDEARATEEAQSQALRSAVEQAAGVRIDADSVVINNQLVRDQVFANTSGYVKKFEVTSKKVEKGVVKIAVKAEVITDNLDKDIAAARDVVKRAGRPSIVVVVQEQTLLENGKGVANSEVMATVLTDKLKEDGWLVKDAHALNGALSLEGAVTLGATEMKKVNDLLKVRYMLYGKANIRREENPPMMKGAPVFLISGEYDLTLADTESGEQVAKVAGKLQMSPKTEMVTNYERTAYNVITERRDEIVAPVRKAILEHLRSTQVNGSTVDLVVSGLDTLGAANDFRRSIETLKGAKNNGSELKFSKGTARFSVDFLGKASELASAAETSTFKKKKIAVSEVGSTKVELSVTK